MSLDQLLAALEQEAQAEADRILTEACGEAERLDAETDMALARQREGAIGRLELELTRALEARLSTARLAARREVLRARERLLARLFTALEESVASLAADPRHLDGLSPRLTAALACFESGTPLRLDATPALVEHLTADAELPATTIITADPSLGTGFRLATADGRMEVIDTLESRIAARRTLLARRALAILGIDA